MQSLKGKFHLARKPAIMLASVISLGAVALAYLPSSWSLLRAAALFASAFCAGLLVSQHAAIWEDSAPAPTDATGAPGPSDHGQAGSDAPA